MQSGSSMGQMRLSHQLWHAYCLSTTQPPANLFGQTVDDGSGPLPSSWEIWMELLAPGFSVAQLWPTRPFGKWPNVCKISLALFLTHLLTLCVSVSVSFQIWKVIVITNICIYMKSSEDQDIDQLYPVPSFVIKWWLISSI